MGLNDISFPSIRTPIDHKIYGIVCKIHGHVLVDELNSIDPSLLHGLLQVRELPMYVYLNYAIRSHVAPLKSLSPVFPPPPSCIFHEFCTVVIQSADM